MSYSKATLSPERLMPVLSRRSMIWSIALLLLLACCAGIVLATRQPQTDPRLTFPRIHGAGGVLPVAPNALMPSPTAVHRLYVDIDNDTAMHGDVSAGLHTAAKILNLYALAGVPADKVNLVVLFYGEGVNLALSDEAYEKKFGHPNPNANLLAQLRQAKVKMVVCGQALGHQSFVAEDIRPGMALALSALTAREELQAAGYGAVPQEQ